MGRRSAPGLARRWTRREGPIGGPLQTWAALLLLISAVERGVSSVQRCYAESEPDLLRLARRWAGAEAGRLRATHLDAALAETWSDITATRAGGLSG